MAEKFGGVHETPQMILQRMKQRQLRPKSWDLVGIVEVGRGRVLVLEQEQELVVE